MSKKSTSGEWSSLTWHDLESWAGATSVSRGRTYQRDGCVRDLAQSPDGRLLATVIGRARYAVTVWLTAAGRKADRLRSECTCPVGPDGCKHAVATVAEYLDQVGGGAEIPVAEADDPRWAKLQDEGAELDRDDEDEEDEEETPTPAPRSKPAPAGRENWDEQIKRHVAAKGHDELVDLVCSLTQRFPELGEEFRERIALAGGDVDRLVAQARQEIQRVTGQEAWRNHWSGEGNTPDYSKVLTRLERLLEMGHADAVVRLGAELMKRGFEQVGRAHDEGETGEELARCMPAVFRAVAQSSLTPAQKLLFAIDAELHDDYGVIGDTPNAVFDQKYPPAEWSAVADELARRLERGAFGHEGERSDEDHQLNDFSDRYQRERVSDWLTEALANAGRGEQVLAIYEAEARATGSYERLVAFLIEQKRYDDAHRWATEGIEKTVTQWPGVAAKLADQLAELARRRKQWDVAAAHAAFQFFDRPSRDGFTHLLTAAERAGCEVSVRQFAQSFLETGASPIRSTARRKGGRMTTTVQTAPGWPLPVPNYLLPLLRSERGPSGAPAPRFDVLIELAVAQRRPDDVLRWYDQMHAAKKPSPYGGHYGDASNYADLVAKTVADTHPQRAIEIYRQRIEASLGTASVSAYEVVASYLRRLKPIMISIGLVAGWSRLLADIRLRYRNRPRLMEALDTLEKRTIVAQRKARRR